MLEKRKSMRWGRKGSIEITGGELITLVKDALYLLVFVALVVAGVKIFSSEPNQRSINQLDTLQLQLSTLADKVSGDTPSAVETVPVWVDGEYPIAFLNDCKLGLKEVSCICLFRCAKDEKAKCKNKNYKPKCQKTLYAEDTYFKDAPRIVKKDTGTYNIKLSLREPTAEEKEKVNRKFYYTASIAEIT